MTSTTPVARPVGVTIIAVLLIIAGILGLIAGVLGIIAGIAAMAAGAGSAATFVFILAVVALLIGALNLVFAFGILRGNRAARMIVTILQVISVVAGVVGLVMNPAAETMWSHIFNIAVPVIILVLLWVGEQTKAFFDQRSYA